MAGLPSAAFLSLFRKQADSAGVMPFDRFMELALYDSVLGYYRAPRARVGTGEGTDFYTAESSTSLFGELVSASCEALLLSQGVPAADFDFVEIGAEPGTGLLEGLKHPFAAYRCLRLGQKLELPERCIVFSNELFDAQPCRRFLRRNSAWLELGVGERDAALVEIEMPHLVSEPWLPSEAPEGCRFDAPRASVALAETLVRPSWQGLFIAFDYGKRSTELVDSFPQGTMRAYRHHKQETDLLAEPGEQDLTCPVCWDWLQAALETRDGFRNLALESQEAFFVKHAGSFISRFIASEASRASRRKLALMQLLHPGNMGQKFQVLSAFRLPFTSS